MVNWGVYSQETGAPVRRQALTRGLRDLLHAAGQCGRAGPRLASGDGGPGGSGAGTNDRLVAADLQSGRPDPLSRTASHLIELGDSARRPSRPVSYARVVMRATIAYTSARILLLVIAMILLYLAGARGLLLLALAFMVSGTASFVLLSRQRDIMSGALLTRIKNGRNRAAGFRTRLEEGARAE